MPLILKRNLKLPGGFIGNGDPPPPVYALGYTSKLSKQTHLYFYVAMSRCCYASPEIVLKKNAKLFPEVSSCLCGFAVKLC